MAQAAIAAISGLVPTIERSKHMLFEDGKFAHFLLRLVRFSVGLVTFAAVPWWSPFDRRCPASLDGARRSPSTGYAASAPPMVAIVTRAGR